MADTSNLTFRPRNTPPLQSICGGSEEKAAQHVSLATFLGVNAVCICSKLGEVRDQNFITDDFFYSRVFFLFLENERKRKPKTIHNKHTNLNKRRQILRHAPPSVQRDKTRERHLQNSYGRHGMRGSFNIGSQVK